jgi:hypothetical protein
MADEPKQPSGPLKPEAVAPKNTEPPTAGQPIRSSVPGQLKQAGIDPLGRVKQQDAAGNFIADERDIQKEREEQAGKTTPQPMSPAVATDSKTNFTKQKIEELERQVGDAEQLQGTRRYQAVAAIRAQIRELREREARTWGGADIRAPRGNILHAEEAIAMHPEYHYRLVNILTPGKAENALAMGYEKVPSDEGGKTLGDLALFRIPMERHSVRVGARDVETKRKIQSVAEDLKGEVREMAKFLRHRGVDIDENRLGVFGESD